jgi:hypothetical protein
MLEAKARYVAMVKEIENCNFQNFFTVRSSDEEVVHQILFSQPAPNRDDLMRYEDHISDKTSVSKRRDKLNIQDNRYFSWRKSRSQLAPSQIDYDSSPETERLEVDFMCKSKISNFVKTKPVTCPEDNSIIPTIESHEEQEIPSVPSLSCLSPNRKNF